MRNIRIAILKRTHTEQRVFWGVVFAIAFSFVLYIYFVMSMAVFAATQQDISREVTAFQSEIGILESEYLSLNKNIDLTFALELGYSEPEEVTFARETALVRGDL